MIRPIHVVAVLTALVFACDSPSTGPSQAGTRPAVAPLADRTEGDGGGEAKIVSFKRMYGVDEAFLNHDQIRGVLGDELPWVVGKAEGSLSTSGKLSVHVRGIVFANVPEVPPELRGINDETQFRALVSCLVPGATDVSTVNITTQGFPSTKTGDSNIDAQVQLPSDCVAPIIFVLSGSEDKWFAVMGAEISG